MTWQKKTHKTHKRHAGISNFEIWISDIFVCFSIRIRNFCVFFLHPKESQLRCLACLCINPTPQIEYVPKHLKDVCFNLFVDKSMNLKTKKKKIRLFNFENSTPTKITKLRFSFTHFEPRMRTILTIEKSKLFKF